AYGSSPRRHRRREPSRRTRPALSLLLRRLLQERLHGRRELRALAHPIVHSRAVDLHVRRILLGVVVADLLDGRRTRRLLRVGHDDPVKRRVAHSAPAQTNFQHSFTPLSCLPNTSYEIRISPQRGRRSRSTPSPPSR